MKSCPHPLRNITTTAFLLLSHITLALGVPTFRHETIEVERRTFQDVHGYNNKRAVSVGGAGRAIAGGAAGLVILALFIGLGSASIALFGSIEWSELRGKKKEQKGATQAKGVYDSDSESDSDSIEEYKEKAMQQPKKGEAVTNEKPSTSQLKMSRLTLKRFLPMDFGYAWGSNNFKS